MYAGIYLSDYFGLNFYLMAKTNDVMATIRIIIIFDNQMKLYVSVYMSCASYDIRYKTSKPAKCGHAVLIKNT